MPKDATRDLKGRPLSVAGYSIVERQRAEIPVEGKWPKAWRLWFLIVTAILFWGAIFMIVRL